MSYKKNRGLRVYEICGKNYERVPQIKLQGSWLKEIGFAAGTAINVECQSGKSVITLSNEYIGTCREL